ncbi:MAG: hypothetical protein AAF577_12050 [Pseudomonadota bacterium]
MTTTPLQHSDRPQLHRRGVLLGAAGIGLATAAGGGLVMPAPAAAASGLAQAPYFYRFRIGALVGTVVSDGILPLGDPKGSFIGPHPTKCATC